MKKNGFTLAEILITLGIVGVVAALTAPALVKNTAGAKVGPTLAKVVNTIEVANEQLMLDQNISDLSKAYKSSEAYFNALSRYIRKGGYNSTKRTTVYKYSATHNPTTEDDTYTGEYYLPEGASIYSEFAVLGQDSPTSWLAVRGEYCICYVDINGSNSGNNMLGDDVFVFHLDRSGVLIPYGSQAGKRAYGDETWEDDYCNEKRVGGGYACTGSIFENNLKIIYQ